MKIERLRTAHIDKLGPLRMADAIAWGPWDVAKLIDQYARLGPSYAGLVDDQIVFVAGVAEIMAGMGEAWCISTSLVEKYPGSFHKAVRRYLDIIEEVYLLYRIQAVVHRDHIQSHKWMASLGFRPEGWMNHYSPDGVDYMRYARIKSWAEQ